MLAGLWLAAGFGCHHSESDPGRDAEDPEGRSLFVEGCPVSGLARAALIERPDLGMLGPQALGEEGDFLLMNDESAFIVTSPDDVDAYWYYGGILVDAVALDGCRQAGPERYEEFLPLVAQVNLLEFLEEFDLGAVTIRGFRGERAEVLSDGSDGGDAVVRVHGTDDTFWLIEYTLVAAAFSLGAPRPPSSPLGLDIFIDYILPPDSPVLRIEVHYRNREGRPQAVVPATAHLFGPTTDVYFSSLTGLSLADYYFHVGIPWITSASPTGDGSLTFAMEGATLMGTSISGVFAAFDIARGLLPLRLGPAGSAGDTASVTYFMSVGITDGVSSEIPLQNARPRAFPWAPCELLPFAGRAVDAGTGEPISGAELEVQVKDLDGSWRPLHRFRTNAAGAFGGAVADFGSPDTEYRLTGRVDGRPAPEPIPFTTADIPRPTVAFEPGGVLAHEVRNWQGRPMPALITLWQDGSRTHRILSEGIGEAPVPPGTYEVSVTRGYEYKTFHESVTIEPSVPTPLRVRLDRVVDTTDFLSMDGHMHAAPSPDSQVSIPDRIRTAAAAGLDVAMSTDHEYIGSWQSGIDETGLDDWVATVTGLELTAHPEHVNLYSVEPQFDVDGRGNFVRWYGLDIAEIYAAARERGAGVVTLNHPNYMRLVGYDRLTGTALLDDPTDLGLAAGAELWSWNFDAIEYMNGHRSPFDVPGGNGYFDDWMSFHNFGHAITAMGTSDIHGMDHPGEPRTYFASSTDNPRRTDESELVASLLAGRALVSAGAFARVEINGAADMGDLMTDGDGSVDLAVHIEALPEIDVTHFLVFVNCDEALKVAASDPGGIVKYDGDLAVPVSQDAHIVVAGFGSNRLPRGLSQYDPNHVPRFTTNPIYVDVDGNGIFDPPGGKTCTYDLDPPL